MDIFVARQPIFDCDMNVVAYGLLYQDGYKNKSSQEGDKATASVIVNGPLIIGLETLTDGKKAYIKFSKHLLLEESATLFGPEAIIIEVKESFDRDSDFCKSIKNLKLEGYTIAIEDFSGELTFEDIKDYASIIKVDFQENGVDDLTFYATKFRGSKIQLFAYNLESHEEFQFAKKLGYSYFQGNFFEKPVIVKSKDIRMAKGSHIKIMTELNVPDPDFVSISKAIEDDIALTYKLLKLVNSGAYSGRGKITSLKQALVRLGLKEIYKWLGLIVIRDIGDHKPEIYVRTSMIRAKALESLSTKVKLSQYKNEFFLIGMFSMIDTILDRPMEEILDELPLSDEVIEALEGTMNHYRQGLDIILAYERGDWESVEKAGEFGTGLIDELLFKCYFDAIKWTQSLYVD